MDGASAIKLVTEANISSDPFELLIIDWKMPNMDGIEVTRRIREEIKQSIPIIILTAYDWLEIEHEPKEAGVTAFLSKPFYRSKICYLLNELDEEKEVIEIKDTSPAPAFNGKRILLVEDNLLNLEIAHTLIEEMGITVEDACDGEEAVQKIIDSNEYYYNLILMDIQMPKMDGYEATKVIRKLNKKDTKDIPIIAMTANAFEEDKLTALQAGMTEHFSKPIDADELEKLLKYHLLQK